MIPLRAALHIQSRVSRLLSEMPPSVRMGLPKTFIARIERELTDCWNQGFAHATSEMARREATTMPREP